MNRLLVFVLLMSALGCDPPSDSQSPGDGDASEKNGASDVASDAAEWATDRWSSAVTGGGQAIENSSKWLVDLYQRAKDEGITRASSVREWVTDDWKAQGDWQYKIIKFEPGDLEVIEAELNALGQERWDCFHVEPAAEQWTFLLKRPKRSYLKNLPLRDFANILPAVSADGDSNQ